MNKNSLFVALLAAVVVSVTCPGVSAASRCEGPFAGRLVVQAQARVSAVVKSQSLKDKDKSKVKTVVTYTPVGREPLREWTSLYERRMEAVKVDPTKRHDFSFAKEFSASAAWMAKSLETFRQPTADLPYERAEWNHAVDVLSRRLQAVLQTGSKYGDVIQLVFQFQKLASFWAMGTKSYSADVVKSMTPADKRLFESYRSGNSVKLDFSPPRLALFLKDLENNATSEQVDRVLNAPDLYFYIPTQLSLSKAHFNRIAGVPLLFLGLSTRVQYIDGGTKDPLSYTGHDGGHGSIRIDNDLSYFYTSELSLKSNALELIAQDARLGVATTELIARLFKSPQLEDKVAAFAIDEFVFYRTHEGLQLATEPVSETLMKTRQFYGQLQAGYSKLPRDVLERMNRHVAMKNLNEARKQALLEEGLRRAKVEFDGLTE